MFHISCVSPNAFCDDGGSGGQQRQEQSGTRAGRARHCELLKDIGNDRGGQTDERCRPVAFLLTGGQVPDCLAAQELLEKSPECAVVNADKGYDADGLRRKIKAQKPCFSPFLYPGRNAIERMFCRLKDFRRLATRCDRNAATLPCRRLSRSSR